MKALQIGKKYKIIGPDGAPPEGTDLENLEGWDSGWNKYIGKEILINDFVGNFYQGSIYGERIDIYPWEVEEIIQREWDE